MEAAISTKNVEISYDSRPVVSGVSFEIMPGSITMIIGPNGSGKTTLLKALAGLLPFSGEINLFGKRQPGAPARLGYVPQRFSFDRSIPITVQEFLSLSSPRCFTDQCIHQKLYQDVGVAKIFTKPVSDLSGGQLQRVLIARALLEEPQILLLDEPASGIDIEGQNAIHKVLRDITREKKTTVVMISHEFNIVNHLADQVLCLNRELVCQGRPAEALTPEVIKKLYGEHRTIYAHPHD